jgi:hypothetical protein
MERSAEISTLLKTVHQAEQRLKELGEGEIDTLIEDEGRTPFCHAPNELAQGKSWEPGAIFDALPTPIALLDSHGIILWLVA